MDKRDLYFVWQHLRVVKPWYVLAVALVSTGVCVVELRANNLHMAQLRTAVYEADKDNGNVQKALQDLQLYVTSHMNTDLSSGPNAPYPPIQLVYTYDRAIQAAGDQVAAANSQIYTDAQHYCEQVNSRDYYGTNRVPCVQQYVREHGVTNIPTIPDSLYKFSFVSPKWSPDLAGWSMVLAIVSYATAILLWVSQWWLRRVSK